MNYHNTPSLVESARPVTVKGKALCTRLRGKAPAVRASAALDIARGEIVLAGMSLKHAAQFCGVALGYVETLSRLSPGELARVQAHPWTLAQIHQRGREMSDADIDNLVARIGADRLRASLDRATAPAPELVAGG